MDSLFNILSNRVPDEPPEIKVVRQYVRHHFHENAHVAVRDKDIIVTVRSSALAGTLRTRAPAIRRELGGSDRRLIFRIGAVGPDEGVPDQ